MSNPPTYPRGTVEYVKGIATCSVPITDTMTVSLSLSTGGDSIGYTHVWLAGTWEGAEATTRIARTASPVTFDAAYPSRAYTLFLKVSDNPETPLINAGTVRVTG